MRGRGSSTRALRVFVSFTSELAQFPAGHSFVDAACAGVRRVDAVPVTMADFGARKDVPLDVCRAEVLGCDVHLSVIGFRYGSPIPGLVNGISYTEFEFDTATSSGLPRLVFLVDDQTPIPPALVDEDRSRINRFRHRVRSGIHQVVTAVVDDPGRLEAAVTQALVRLVEHGRSAAAGATAADTDGLWMLPAPDALAVPRPDLARALVESLTAPSTGAAGVITAVEGPGGFGKSTLVAMVCREPEVRARFRGGLLWLTVGERPHGAGLAALIGELCALLSGEAPATADPMLAGGRLGELLDAGEPALLVLDDVWRAEQLAPFLVGGDTCHRLVTTRNAGIVSRGSGLVAVHRMTAPEAVQALTAGLDELPAGLSTRLLAATGRWPTLIGLVNAALVDKVQLGATATESAEWALGRLDQLGPTAFDAEDAGSRDRTVAATLGASLDLLSPDERSRYLELTVFPGDVDVPDSAVGLLWRATAGMDAADTERLRARLARLRLVSTGWSGHAPTMQLHDVLRAYLRGQCSAQQLRAWSRAFVEEARALLSGASGRPTPWWLLPEKADYLWRTLPHHLVEAGLTGELAHLVCDLRWVRARIARTGSTAAAEADLGLVDVPAARELRSVLGRASHLLTPLDPPDALGATLASRLDAAPGWAAAVAAFRAGLPGPQLVPAWPLPDHPQPALVRTLSGHDGGVYGCGFDPEGNVLASVGEDRTVRLWDVATGASAVIGRHADRVYACAFSPDGTRLATVSEDRTARLWDAVTGSLVAVLDGHTDRVHTCGFSPDGRQLATASDDQTVRLWDARDGTLRGVLTCLAEHVAGLSYGGDGIRLAGVSEGPEIHVCDPSAGSVRTVRTSHTGRINACALSSDGSLVVSAGTDGTLGVSDAIAGRAIEVLNGHRDQVLACALAPDGGLVASAGEDRTARLWETGTGRAHAVLAGHTDRVYGCAFSPDGALVATAAGDGMVCLWDVPAAGGQAMLAGHSDRVSGCAFSPDGSRLASASWDRTVRLWDVAAARTSHVLSGHRDRVSDCSFSPDGGTVATASWDGGVSLWVAGSGSRRAVLPGHDDRAYGCAFSSAGDLLGTAGADGAVRLWDVASGACLRVLAGHAGPVHRCRFAPGGELLASAGVDGAVRLWHLASEGDHTRLAGHTGWVLDCAFAPDGGLLASAGVDGTIRLWDVASGRTVRVLGGPGEWVHACAFSPDGALLAAVDAAGTVRVWDRRTGRCRCALRLSGRLLDCAWHPRGDRLAVAGVRGITLLRIA